MADTYTSLPIKTKNPGDVVSKIVDSLGSNILTVDSSGRITVNNNFAGNADGQTATSSGQAVGLVGYNGTTWDRLQVDGSKYLKVNVAAGSLTVSFPLPGNADATAAAANQSTGISGFNGTTWDRLRSYAGNADAVTSPTLGLLGASGFLFGYNGTSWDRLQVDGSKYLKVNVAAGSLTVSFPLPGNADATAAAANQSTGISGFNGTTWDRLRSDTNKWLYTDVGAINGATLGAPVAAGSSASGNILAVQGVSGGVAQPVTFGSPGTLQTSGQQISPLIAVSSSQTISSGIVTNAKVGTLQHAIFSSSVPCRWDLQTVNTSSVATIVFSTFTSASNLTYEWKAQNAAELATVSSDGTHVRFEVVATNQDNTNAASAYATFWWAEN